MSRLKPRHLEEGDLIQLVSPGGPARADRIAAGIRLLTNAGYQTRLTDSAAGRLGHYSASHVDRLSDLQTAFDDPAVAAVLCTRGGYGSDRLVDALDLRALQSHPKIFLGFSDNTALHLLLNSTLGLTTCYGPPLAWDESRTGELSRQSLLYYLRGDVIRGTCLATVSSCEDSSVLRVGTSDPEGLLLGGNLTMLGAACGTATQPAFEGAILLIEEVREHAYRIDRLLTQLRRSHCLDGVAGIAVGQVTACPSLSNGPSAVEVIGNHMAELGVPILGGLPVGHGPNQVSLPLGSMVRLCISTQRIIALDAPLAA